MKNLTMKFKKTVKVFCLASMCTSSTWVIADDTEVFYSENVSKPNLLFVLDISGSMKGIVPNSGSDETLSHTVNKKITHRKDDAEQAVSGGKMLLRDDFLDIGYDYYDLKKPQRTGLRFQNLDIPQGATITNAYIQFTVKEVSDYTDSAISLIISGEASSDAERFSNSDKIHARTLISAQVAWAPPVWEDVGDNGEDQRTPDLSTMVQAIIDRSGWNNNNGMAFIIEGVAGDRGSRVAKSYDDNQSSAPKLHVEYDTVAPGGNKTRLEVMQTAFRRVLEQAPDNVKVGLMNYGQAGLNRHNAEQKRQHSVSGVAFPITDINGLVATVISEHNDVDNLPNPSDVVTVRDYLPDVADTWAPSNWTPIVDSLYEAALYFRGEKVHYGDTLPSLAGAHPSTYDGDVITQDVAQTARDHGNAPSYISPMQSSCQSNYIVLMSDGEPTYIDSDNHFTEGPFSLIRNTSAGPQGALATAITSCESPAGEKYMGTCGADITKHIATHDNSAEFTGDQLIKTFSIGFGSGVGASTKAYLKSLATVEDDPDTSAEEKGYYDADSPESLANAFNEILAQVAKPSGTLASPGYSVNVRSGLEHEKDIYIPVFDRKNTSRWSGNLKKFRLIEVGDDRLIRGKNNLNAVDALGGFSPDAWDYWSDSTEADGIAIEKGGVASKLHPHGRKVYSNLTSDEDLTASDNLLVADNHAIISNTLLDIPSDSTMDYRKKLINFIRGWKYGVEGSADANANEHASNGTARQHMGDMLHSEPVIITYTQADEDGDGKQQYIFAATNEGFLHVFDTHSGEEIFAFMPKELLKNINVQFENTGSAKTHKYGIDGALTYWHADTNKDGNVNNGENVYLYFGLRRGGSSFYALDISDIDNPEFKWVKSADDHASMGQSWSIPYLGRVKKPDSSCINGVNNCKEVVIVSGGYDDIEDRDNDSASSSVTTRVGKDVLMFDAETGALVWSLRNSVTSASTLIKDSTPGGVRYLDTNIDGLIDRLYFGDTGGNVWRVDIPDNKITGSTQLTKLAMIQGSERQGARKIYNEPDVSKMKIKGKTVFLVSIGTGFRAHPMDRTIEDGFFMLVDDSPYRPIDSDEFETIIVSDLSKIKITGTVGAFNVDQSGTLASSRGWDVSLPEEGEKVLATALTFDGVVAFTTLVPEALVSGAGVDQCAAPVVQGRLYAINILTGKAGLELDATNSGDADANGGSDVLSPNDISTLVSKGEIPGSPQVLFNSLDVDKEAGTCRHPVDIRIGKKLSQATGYDACRLESVYWSDPVNID